MEFKPYYRPRRLRKNALIRGMVRETTLTMDDLILPLFVTAGKESKPISSMPGHSQLTLDDLKKEVKELEKMGVKAIILFGIPALKDAGGSDVRSKDGIIAQALRVIKDINPNLYVITDVCFCEYTDHGHCGHLTKDGDVDNDATLEMLQEQVIVQAQNGVDMVAPSGMMDGMIGAIREGLDASGFEDIPIMSYAAKYASGFYGPFREAAESTPAFGDRASYQMDPANVMEAVREMELDVEEGADILMVKPAMPYLDIIRIARERFELPVAAYQVSGEFAMIKAAAEKGWLDHDRVALESLMAIKRAGADLILSYFTKEAVRWVG